MAAVARSAATRTAQRGRVATASELVRARHDHCRDARDDAIQKPLGDGATVPETEKTEH